MHIYIPIFLLAFYFYLPKKFTEDCGRELRILPTAETKQLDGLFRVATIFNNFLHITSSHKQNVCYVLLKCHYRLR